MMRYLKHTSMSLAILNSMKHTNSLLCISFEKLNVKLNDTKITCVHMCKDVVPYVLLLVKLEWLYAKDKYERM